MTSTFSSVFDHLRGLVASGKLPSAVFGVTDAKGVLALDAFGRWPDGSAIAPDNPYLLWSVTKPVTGLAMMQLWERAQIDLNAEVKAYLHWFGQARTDKVTLWHLLTHTSGISEQTLAPGNSKRHHLQQAGVSFRAGAHKQYSNQAFVAMEEILEEVGGLSLEDHLQKNVFQPLGMQRTTFDQFSRDPDGFVPMIGTEKVPIDYLRFLTLKHPAAGLFSTAPDLLTLGRCLINLGAHPGGRIISRLTLREMIRPQTAGIESVLPDDWTANNDFGLTWIVPTYSKFFIHRDMYGHNGWGGCRFWVYPNEGVALVLMTNLMDPGAHGVNLDLIHNLFTAEL